MPKELSEIESLPGLGRYSACAVLCLAHAGARSLVGPRADSDHTGLLGVGAGPVGESDICALIHTLDFGWGDAWPRDTWEH